VSRAVHRAHAPLPDECLDPVFAVEYLAAAKLLVHVELSFPSAGERQRC